MATMTIGSVLVACRAASGPVATSTSRFCCTSAAARSGSHSAVPLGGAVLEDEVLALSVSELPQVGLERLDKGRGARLARVQPPDADDVPRRLHVRPERRGEHAQGQGEDDHDNAEPHDGLLQSM